MRTAWPVISEKRFRKVLGHYCSGVAVITANDAGKPVGFSCQSFQSVSLDPPLVSFAPARTSTTWPRVRRAGTFVANVLAEDQDELCRGFAVSGGEKFSGVRWRPSPSGSPVLDGVLAWVECAIVEEVGAGDHVIVLGRVLELDADQDRQPLLFFRGGFGALRG